MQRRSCSARAPLTGDVDKGMLQADRNDRRICVEGIWLRWLDLEHAAAMPESDPPVVGPVLLVQGFDIQKETLFLRKL